MTHVVVSDLSASYGKTLVLKRLSFEVPSSSMLAVLGASGSGKTTLLRVLAGFKRMNEGTIAFGQMTVADDRTWVATKSRGVGIVPQEGALFPHLSVEKNVAFGLHHSENAKARVREVLELVGMQDFAKRNPHELSGGQAQRVALARALAPEPNLLLLDEPFSALEQGLREELGFEVKQLLESLKTTSILVTHDQEEALGLADQVLVIMNGTAAQQGSPQDVYQSPATAQVGHFVGDLIELPVTQWSGNVVQSALGSIEVTQSPKLAEDVVVCVRPEQISLGSGNTKAKVCELRYHGYDTVVTLELSAGEHISARVHGSPSVKVGEFVLIGVLGTGLIFPAS